MRLFGCHRLLGALVVEEARSQRRMAIDAIDAPGDDERRCRRRRASLRRAPRPARWSIVQPARLCAACHAANDRSRRRSCSSWRRTATRGMAPERRTDSSSKQRVECSRDDFGVVARRGRRAREAAEHGMEQTPEVSRRQLTRQVTHLAQPEDVTQIETVRARQVVAERGRGETIGDGHVAAMEGSGRTWSRRSPVSRSRFPRRSGSPQNVSTVSTSSGVAPASRIRRGDSGSPCAPRRPVTSVVSRLASSSSR